jgi:hypothetical protein
MELEYTPRVTSVASVEDGVIIMFEDGKTALYSASLLRSIFTQAEELFETEHTEA